MAGSLHTLNVAAAHVLMCANFVDAAIPCSCPGCEAMSRRRVTAQCQLLLRREMALDKEFSVSSNKQRPSTEIPLTTPRLYHSLCAAHHLVTLSKHQLTQRNLTCICMCSAFVQISRTTRANKQKRPAVRGHV